MARKMDPYSALEILQFTTNAAARPLAKAIKTVVANAGSKEGLSFKSIEINEGIKMKRYRVGTAGRGRGRPYKKRTSHIKIVLTDEIKQKVSKVSKVSRVPREEKTNSGTEPRDTLDTLGTRGTSKENK